MFSISFYTVWFYRNMMIFICQKKKRKRNMMLLFLMVILILVTCTERCRMAKEEYENKCNAKFSGLLQPLFRLTKSLDTVFLGQRNVILFEGYICKYILGVHRCSQIYGVHVRRRQSPHSFLSPVTSREETKRKVGTNTKRKT